MIKEIETTKLNEQDLRAAIKEQQFIIRQANSEIIKLEGELANLLAEFKIGDKVYCSNFQGRSVCVITKENGDTEASNTSGNVSKRTELLVFRNMSCMGILRKLRIE